jgi:hypothetical protein
MVLMMFYIKEIREIDKGDKGTQLVFLTYEVRPSESRFEPG